MNLSILDIRENELKAHSAVLEFGKNFLKETVVLAWDNKIPKSKLDTYLLQKPTVDTKNDNIKYSGPHPLLIVTPTPEQLEYFSNILWVIRVVDNLI